MDYNPASVGLLLDTSISVQIVSSSIIIASILYSLV